MILQLWFLLCFNRNRRYRQKLKLEEKPLKKKIHMTKSKKKKLQEYWRQKKKESRQRASSQKARRVKEYDRMRHSDETLEINKKKERTHRNKLYTAKSRFSSKLPKDSTVAAEVIMASVEKATPRKRRIFKQRGFIPYSRKEIQSLRAIATSLHQEEKQAKRKIVKKLFKRKVCPNKKQISQLLGVRYRWLQNACLSKEEHKLGKKISDSDINVVKDFYLRPEISTCIPDKKLVNKHGPRHVLKRSLLDTFQKFNVEYPGKMKKTKFCEFRPKNCKTVDTNKWVQSLCPKCANAELMIKTINRAFEVDGKLTNKYDLIKLVQCETDGERFNNPECIKGQCLNCGFNNFMKLISGNDGKVLVWNRWENRKIEQTGVSKMGLRPYEESSEGFFKVLEKDLKLLPQHLFVASWQYSQFELLKQTLHVGDLLLVVDFGENYRHQYQEEVSSMHWMYQQSTIHPVVCFYRADAEESVNQTDIIVLSSDTKHDLFSAEAFTQQAIDMLALKTEQEFKSIIRFSDTCASQYRSKNTFHMLSNKSLPTTYVYFGANHGKGPADGALATVKSLTTRNVKGGNVIIRNTKEWFQFCEAELTVKKPGYTRMFLYVEEVDHKAQTVVKAIPNTLSIQCVKNDASQNLIHIRNLACFCEFCYSHIGTECLHVKHVDQWKSKPLQHQKEKPLQVESGGISINTRSCNQAKDVASKGESIQASSTKNLKLKVKTTSAPEAHIGTECHHVKHVDQSKSKPLQHQKEKPLQVEAGGIRINTRSRNQGKKVVTKGKSIPGSSAKNLKLKVKTTSAPGGETINVYKVKEKLPKKQKKTDNKMPESLPSVPQSGINKPPNYTRYTAIMPVLNSMNLALDYMREDGNCFYRTISKCTTGVDAYFADIRCMVCDFMNENIVDFQQYIDGDVQQHIKKMRKNATWAESAEIFATASMLERDIYVLTPTDIDQDRYDWLIFRKDPRFPLNSESSCKCHITMVNSGALHYDRVCGMNGNCNCGISPPELERLVYYYF